MCLCTGCTSGDYNKKDALESAVVEKFGYSDTDEYMTYIGYTYAIKYGENFEILPKVSHFKRLSTDECNERAKLIAETFDVSEPSISDAYSFICTESVSGSTLTGEEDGIEYFILVIDNKAYLYDLTCEQAKVAYEEDNE